MLKGEIFMTKYLCIACGYIYDPEVGDPDNGVEPGTSFEDVPDDWLCPLCGVGKDQFEPTDQNCYFKKVNKKYNINYLKALYNLK